MRQCLEDGITILSPQTGPQSRTATESIGLEATFPKETALSQAAPLAGLDNPLTKWDSPPAECTASAASSSTDHLELGKEFSVPAACRYELGLVEERPAPCPSPQAPLPRQGWDDELQKPEAQVYLHFMQKHTCYDAMATSSKLVIFDTTLEVRPRLCSPPSLQGCNHCSHPPGHLGRPGSPASPLPEFLLSTTETSAGGLLFSVRTPQLSSQL